VENFGGDLEMKRLDLTCSGQVGRWLSGLRLGPGHSVRW